MLKIKIIVLCLMLSGALYSLQQAISGVDSLKYNALPENIYSSYMDMEDKAEYYLKSNEGYVTVYEDREFKTGIRRTDIECNKLRRADRAMLEKGIPVRDRQQLLQLLEDLKS